MNKKSIILNQSGITLIEILIAIIVLGIIMSIVTPMIIQSFTIVEDSSVRISQNRLADIMLEEISKYFKSIIPTSYTNKNIDGLKIYEFEAFSPQDGNKKNYKIVETSDSNLEFREEGNLLNRIENINNFNIKNDSPLYTLNLKFTNENGVELNKQLNIFTRNQVNEE